MDKEGDEQGKDCGSKSGREEGVCHHPSSQGVDRVRATTVPSMLRGNTVGDVPHNSTGPDRLPTSHHIVHRGHNNCNALLHSNSTLVLIYGYY